MELVCEEGDVMVSRILGVCSREEELNVWGDNIERATATTHTHGYKTAKNALRTCLQTFLYFALRSRTLLSYHNKTSSGCSSAQTVCSLVSKPQRPGFCPQLVHVVDEGALGLVHFPGLQSSPVSIIPLLLRIVFACKSL